MEPEPVTDPGAPAGFPTGRWGLPPLDGPPDSVLFSPGVDVRSGPRAR